MSGFVSVSIVRGGGCSYGRLQKNSLLFHKRVSCKGSTVLHSETMGSKVPSFSSSHVPTHTSTDDGKLNLAFWKENSTISLPGQNRLQLLHFQSLAVFFDVAAVLVHHLPLHFSPFLGQLSLLNPWDGPQNHASGQSLLYPWRCPMLRESARPQWRPDGHVLPITSLG